MQLASTWNSFLTTDPVSPADETEHEPLKSSDQELFTRKTFETNPRLGCEILFRRHYVELCSHAVRFVGSKSVAEDLVAEVFCQFYEKQVFSTITSSYRAYLFKTVRNRAYNYIRQSFQRDVPIEEAEAYLSEHSQQPDALTQYDELYQDVEKAIDSLPVQRRKIYLMYRFEGRKYAEIAAELGLSVRTIEVQIRLANQTIREMLKSRWFQLLLGIFFIH
ncbi:MULTISPECIES: RNA polymerase sigma-70 factor [Siphonobacter]|uniref:RNA polymerase sigma-70 factor n=1 Tax=Siphonobacter curvatus TaxID=2094562 RepID=A0A2S7IJI6_9BACT|nr:RNA polymerase sigma-70 factor [Siphonobacter curvatus]PQA56771.1 RNA polymerase sigma-70 factor [Siphonobacter curvatus]